MVGVWLGLLVGFCDLDLVPWRCWWLTFGADCLFTVVGLAWSFELVCGWLFCAFNSWLDGYGFSTWYLLLGCILVLVWCGGVGLWIDLIWIVGGVSSVLG